MAARKWTPSQGNWRHITVAEQSPVVAAISPTQLNLSWSPSTDGVNATNVRVERSSDNITFAEIAQLPRGTLAYSDTSLAHAQTRYYRVRRWKYNTGFGPYSAVASGTTL